jgi:hypothetical protein
MSRLLQNVVMALNVVLGVNEPIVIKCGYGTKCGCGCKWADCYKISRWFDKFLWRNSTPSPPENPPNGLVADTGSLVFLHETGVRKFSRNLEGYGKVRHRTGYKNPEGGVEVWLYCFFNLGVRWGGWSTPRPGRFTPRKDPAHIVWEAEWAPGPVWTAAEIRTGPKTCWADCNY